MCRPDTLRTNRDIRAESPAQHAFPWTVERDGGPPLLRQGRYDCDEHCDDKVAKSGQVDHHASVPLGTRPLRRLPIAGLAAALLLTALPILSGSAHADPLGDARAKAAQISSQLAALEQKQMQLETKVEIAEQRLAEASAAITQAQQHVAEANAALEQKQSDLTAFAVESYVSGNDPQSFEAGMMDPGPSASVKTGYLTSLSGTSSDLIDQVKATRQHAEQQQAALGRARDAAQAQVNAANSAKKSSAAAIAQQHAIQQQVNGQVAQLVAADQQRRRRRRPTDRRRRRREGQGQPGRDHRPRRHLAPRRIGRGRLQPWRRAQRAAALEPRRRRRRRRAQQARLALRLGRRRSEHVRLLRPGHVGLGPGRSRPSPFHGQPDVRHPTDCRVSAATRRPRVRLGTR